MEAGVAPQVGLVCWACRVFRDRYLPEGDGVSWLLSYFRPLVSHFPSQVTTSGRASRRWYQLLMSAEEALAAHPAAALACGSATDNNSRARLHQLQVRMGCAWGWHGPMGMAWAHENGMGAWDGIGMLISVDV